MKKLILLFLISGCASLYQPEVWEHPETGQYTLRLHTGMLAEDIYEKNFEVKAKEICPKGYQIIEKTFKPSTLHKNNYQNSYFNWVIKCI